MQRVRRGLKMLGVTVLPTVVCLLILEVVFQIAGYRPLHDTYSKPELFWKYHPVLGWAHQASQSGVYVGPRPFPVEFQSKVRINSMGLRGAEVTPVPPGGYRVMFLGDSAVAGFEVDDDKTFVALLQGALTKELGAPVQTINAGVRGYGTDQSYLYYRDKGRALRPDLVVFQAAPNDFEDNMTLHRARRPFGKTAFALKDDGRLELIGAPVAQYSYCAGVRLDATFRPVTVNSRSSRAACWVQTNLADHSALFTLVTMRIQQNPQLVEKLYRLGAPTDQAVDTATHGERLRETPGSRLTTALLRELAKTVRADGARFVLSINRPDLMSLDVRTLDADGITRFDSTKVDASGTIEAGAVVKLDTTLQYKNDSHWNERGHARAAELLTPVLARELRAIASDRQHASANEP